MMSKKYVIVILMFIMGLIMVSCQEDESETIPTVIDDTYILLMEAEDLSGMAEKTKVVITQEGSLGLPTSYKGVTITYSSRVPEIISNDGVVTLPDTCWIESRDQQGLTRDDLVGLNDNWPVVIDVILSYQGQQRTAKLLFVVAPQAGYTCDKYLG
jgi:hypothetical protein